MAADATGEATELMLGLHFAGESAQPAKHALSCYASSVFEKLELEPLEPTPEGVAVVAPALGFNLDFLPGQHLELPQPGSPAIKQDFAPTTTGDTVRNYTHYSLAMSASRRFCRWVAWNVDGNGLQQLSRTGLDFVLDKAYDAEYQVNDELYTKNHLDRGHIARRADLLWGTREEANQANVDSFLFTNITPQLDDFNQSKQHGLWGELENAIYEDIEVEDLKISVLGGPLFKDTDFPYRDILVPRSFWKLIAYVEQGELQSKAYVLTQDDLEAKLESLGLEPFKLYQVAMADLSAQTGLDFGALAQADTMPPAPEAVGAVSVRRVEARSEIAAG